MNISLCCYKPNHTGVLTGRRCVIAGATRRRGSSSRGVPNTELGDDVKQDILGLSLRDQLVLIRALDEQKREHDALLKGQNARQSERCGAKRGPLKIIAGDRAGTRLWTPDDARTRPMMARVRGAVFDMLRARGCFDWQPERDGGLLSTNGDVMAANTSATSQTQSLTVQAMPASSANLLRPTIRWLDLYAGTGAVGLEAVSRGATHVTFVEADPWVAKMCLRPNIAQCHVGGSSHVVVSRVEDYLLQYCQNFQAPQFEAVSICPPYELVSYPEVFDLILRSRILHENSYALIEYPRRSAGDILDRLGPLHLLVDRKYGRTLLALYGPAPKPN